MLPVLIVSVFIGPAPVALAMADVCHAFHLSCAWPYAKAAKVALDGWCRCVYVEVRCVERCSNAVLLLVWTHCLN